jgi:hypothetical protein
MRADPFSGIVIADWCTFSTPDARTEVFLAEHLPPTGCPIPPRRSFFGRTFGWFDDLFNRGGRDREGREDRDRARDEEEEEEEEDEERPRRPRIRRMDELEPSRRQQGDRR